MGVTFDVLCEDCDDTSPDLGDGGFIGFPSLGTKRRGRRRIPENFAYIYEGFGAVSLLTQELDGYLEFLYRHVGHKLIVTADTNDVYPGEETKPWFREARSVTVGPSRPAEGQRYVPAHFVASCARCRMTLTSRHSDQVRQGGRVLITPEQASTFLERVVALLDDDFYRSAPFSSDDLEALGGFLKQHRAHQPELSLKAAARGRVTEAEGDAGEDDG